MDGWEDVAPSVKTTPWVQAAVYVNKDGIPRIRLFLSEVMLNASGRPKAAKVQTGMHEGKPALRIVWDPKGPFVLKDMGRGGSRISNIPCKEPLPQSDRISESCEMVSKDAKEAILFVPIGPWELQKSKPFIAPRPAPIPTAIAPAARAPQSAPGKSHPLDAVAYLKTKGKSVARMAGDWYQLDGVRVPKLTVLSEVNRFRKAADLPALGLENIE